MKQRQRKRAFNFAHRVKTFRCSAMVADFMNSMDFGKRNALINKILHDFVNMKKGRK